jgi:hypothetical protein
LGVALHLLILLLRLLLHEQLMQARELGWRQAEWLLWGLLLLLRLSMMRQRLRLWRLMMLRRRGQRLRLV